MKKIIKIVMSSLMAFAVVFCMCTFSVSAQGITEDNTVFQNEMQSVSRSELPSASLVGTGGKSITDWGTIQVDMYNTPQVVREIWIMGNVNGGGANTSASFVSGNFSATAAIDGNWHRIYNGYMLVPSGNALFSVDVVDNSRQYNIAILCY